MMKTALIVDDEQSIRKLLGLLLGRDGYVSHQASNKSEALAKANELTNQSTTIDIITMDFDMPGGNGLETALALRERGINSPIIFLTGNSNNKTAIDAKRETLTPYRFLEKPVGMSPLRATTEELYTQTH